MHLGHLRTIVATAWVGSTWAIGYLAAPTLFATIADRSLAGMVAASLFRSEAWLSLIGGVLLLVLVQTAHDVDTAFNRKQVLLLVGAVIFCTFIGYFALQPYMAELRAAVRPGGVMAPDVVTRFGMLHGLSSGIYLIKSLIGMFFITRLRRA